MNYLLETKYTQSNQNQQLDEMQVENNAGGFVYQVDKWEQLHRFLILGSEGGSYYASQTTLTKENTKVLKECIKDNPQRTVAIIREISEAGRSAKVDTLIFALAVCASDNNASSLALENLPRVCRTASHLFLFLSFIKELELRGFGRSLRRALSEWYTKKSVEDLSYQVIKYRNRYGFTHADVLRLAHPKAGNKQQNDLFAFICNQDNCDLPFIKDYQKLQNASVKEAMQILKENPALPWEALPTSLHNEKEIWNTLLPQMPLGATLRQLKRLTELGVIQGQLADNNNLQLVKDKFNENNIKRSRLHPLQILNAKAAYRVASPLKEIEDVLEKAFYLSFENIEETKKKTLLALDVSGSMDVRLNKSMLSCMQASGALAMVQLKSNPLSEVYAFSAANYYEDKMKKLNISAESKLEEVYQEIRQTPMGATDCALPMLHALENNLQVDAFCIYTDNETWYGDVHPCEALAKYRKKINANARLVVVGMVSNGFSISDPRDPLSLDVVGFDTETPRLVNDFSEGRI